MGKLYILMGPAGSGKTTIGRELGKIFGMKFFTTITTRPMRPGEVQNEDYYFISREEFLKLRAEDKLAEDIEYAGNLYGTTKESLLEIPKSPTDYYVALTIDAYKDYMKFLTEENIVVIFIWANRGTIIQRMKDRGATYEDIEKRLKHYGSDVEACALADYAVTNDIDIDYAVNRIANYIRVNKKKAV